MRDALLVYNPASGRQGAARLVPRLVDALAASGFRTTATPTTGPGDATRLAREAVAAGDAQVVFAMGGDGTLREAAAGLAGSEVALGLLPLGTANVFALSLGVPRAPLAAARAAAGFVPRAVDVGRVAGEPFLMMVSMGLDATVMAAQNARWKRHFGRAAFAVSGVANWWAYRYPPIEVRADGRVEPASLVAVCNIPHYGGDFRMAPAADCCDGHLDLVLFRGRDRLTTLGFLRDLMRGRHLDRPDVLVLRVRDAEVDGPELRAQLDGDPLAAAPPFRVTVEPCCLRVLAPPT